MVTQFATSSDGTSIAYQVTGQGPALVLLHGAGKAKEDWKKAGYIGRLERDFRVIAVDIRGTGESDFLTAIEDYAIELICADLFAVADACDVRRFAVCGYSLGGNIARYLGAWSDRVVAAAIIGVPFGPAVDEAFDRYIDEFIAKYEPLAHAYAEGTLSDKKRLTAIKGRIPVWTACLQAMRLWPSVEPRDMKCPTLLLSGTKNRNTMSWVDANLDELEEAGIQVEIIEGLNHQQEFSQIDSIYPLIASFLAAQREGV